MTKKMTREEALTLLRGGEEGVSEWNRWREADEGIPNLKGADLSDANLSRALLHGANLSDANLSQTNLPGASLSGANLSHALLPAANLYHANLSGSNLINVISDNALLGAFAAEVRPVTRKIVLEVCNDFDIRCQTSGLSGQSAVAYAPERDVGVEE